ncbi:nucleotidyl transferase AbiEii/AbiGii toxin family protein [Carnobacterium gallinarum]|uniref:nucleotidyl transferase AbiEii/AbiGii toxin family protein n=1 Tax=Carnobacterium gallinarum TaxID=2749 RepID=UPI000692609F|nr:nucleotidyl transferase AbiEii/AbiGii toxin family protein [Carnobacterium gallinarum]
MKLHEDSESFKEIITGAANEIGLTEFQVEKDYFVSLLLERIAKIEDVSVVFKGGTSLSKCYSIIDRFSEDIDIAIQFPNEKAGKGLRKRLKYGIKAAIEELGFEFLNEAAVEANKDFNMYEVSYPQQFGTEKHMVPHIIVETIVVYQPYPCENREVSNYVTKFLEADPDYQNIIEKFELQPFEMAIQTIDRTFIDKLFAICDYHLNGKYNRYSRHIYDIHKIWKSTYLKNEQLAVLTERVIEQRQLLGSNTISCRKGQEPNLILQEIIDQAVYEKDYNEVTQFFIYNPVSYAECITSLQKIVNDKMLPDVIKDYSGEVL